MFFFLMRKGAPISHEIRAINLCQLAKVPARKTKVPSGLQLCMAQAERVGDHGNGAEAHRGGGEDRAEKNSEERIENAGCDRDSNSVVDEGEEQVLPDVAHGGLAQPAGAHNSGEIAL